MDSLQGNGAGGGGGGAREEPVGAGGGGWRLLIIQIPAPSPSLLKKNLLRMGEMIICILITPLPQVSLIYKIRGHECWRGLYNNVNVLSATELCS